MKTVDKIINSPLEMKKFGAAAAKTIPADPKAVRGALVIALEGELGAGKTQFVKGFAAGLGIKQKIASPTFVICRGYEIPNSKTNFKKFFHIDLYRLHSVGEARAIGINKILKDPASIIAVEWPKIIGKLMSGNAARLKFSVIGPRRRLVETKI